MGEMDFSEDPNVDRKITLKYISKEIGWDILDCIHLFAQCI